MKHRFSLLVAGSIGIMLTAAAHATIVMSDVGGTMPAVGLYDQSESPVNNYGLQIGNGAAAIGQIFTTPAGGPFTLNAFSMYTVNGYYGAGGNIWTDPTKWTVRVSSVSGTTLTPIGSAVLSAVPGATPSAATWLTFTFSGGDLLTLAGGTSYAFDIQLLSSPGNDNFFLSSNDPGGYAGGRGFQNVGGAPNFTTTIDSQTRDFAFVADLELSVIPEPSTILLLAVGGAIAYRRLRRA